jgi:hypothetical protein
LQCLDWDAVPSRNFTASNTRAHRRISPPWYGYNFAFMLRPFQTALSLAILLTVAAGWFFAPAAGGDAAPEIRALSRVFPEIGPGLVALKRDADGIYYAIAAPAHSVTVFDSNGKRRGEIPGDSSQGGTIVSAEDLDLDSSGRLLVVDRGANAVKIFAPDGSLDATVPVASPNSVVALLGGEFAVSTLGPSPAIIIYDAQGKRLRNFETLPAAARQLALSHYVSLGIMCGDLAGHIYFAYSFLPEPIIRKYDRYGYAIYEIPLRSDALVPEAQDKRREPLSLGHREPAAEKPTINAIAADPSTQEVWAAMGNTLLYFNKDGARRTAYRAFTPEGARLEPRTILVEPDRILLGADPLGIFAFARPDRPSPPAPPRPAPSPPAPPGAPIY